MERSELEDVVARGFSYREIADHFGFASIGLVHYWLKKYQIKIIGKKLKARVSKDQLLEAVEAGLTLQEIANKFGYANSSSAKNRLDKYGLVTVRAANPDLNGKFTEDQLRVAVAESSSINEVLRKLQLSYHCHRHVSVKIHKLKLDTSHFCVKPKTFTKYRLLSDDILVVLPEYAYRTQRRFLKRAMLDKGVLYACVVCGNSGSWQGKPLDLQIDHKDGDWHNNLLENLRFLCPNCHTQTLTYGSKNKK